jgi:hypothetical protein
MLQRIVGGMVRAEVGIKIAQNSDAYGVAHGLIVLEGKRPAVRESGAPRLEAWCGGADLEAFDVQNQVEAE